MTDSQFQAERSTSRREAEIRLRVENGRVEEMYRRRRRTGSGAVYVTPPFWLEAVITKAKVLWVSLVIRWNDSESLTLGDMHPVWTAVRECLKGGKISQPLEALTVQNLQVKVAFHSDAPVYIDGPMRQEPLVPILRTAERPVILARVGRADVLIKELKNAHSQGKLTESNLDQLRSLVLPPTGASDALAELGRVREELVLAKRRIEELERRPRMLAAWTSTPVRTAENEAAREEAVRLLRSATNLPDARHHLVELRAVLAVRGERATCPRCGEPGSLRAKLGGRRNRETGALVHLQFEVRHSTFGKPQLVHACPKDLHGLGFRATDGLPE